MASLFDLYSPLLQAEAAEGLTSLAQVQRVCQLVYRLSPGRKTVHEGMVAEAKSKSHTGSMNTLEMTIDRRKSLSSGSATGQKVSANR